MIRRISKNEARKLAESIEKEEACKKETEAENACDALEVESFDSSKVSYQNVKSTFCTPVP